MVVVDHDQRRLVWAAPGRNSATVGEFFDLLGRGRCARDHPRQSADGADFIDTIVADRCPNAVRVADPFHVVKWATEALDEVRREAWNDGTRRWPGTSPNVAAAGPASRRAAAAGQRAGQGPEGRPVRVVEEPGGPNREPAGQAAPGSLTTDPRLHRAYLLKEGLRVVFQLPHSRGRERWTGGSAGPAAAGSRRS